MTTTPGTDGPEQKAIRLVNRQLEELQETIRATHYKNPKFKAWRDTTRGVLERFLGPQSHHCARFRDTRFFSMTVVPFGASADDVSGEDRMAFYEGCQSASETLKAAIREIEDFGLYAEPSKPAPAGRVKGRFGGVSQNFHGPVSIQNLAIAADSAIQRIGQMGDEAGASLKGIADLLPQSEDLTPRQVKEGLAGIEGLAEEFRKPELKRNWKAVLAYGQAILEIVGRATDLAQKLSPYTGAVARLMEQAHHFVR